MPISMGARKCGCTNLVITYKINFLVSHRTSINLPISGASLFFCLCQHDEVQRTVQRCFSTTKIKANDVTLDWADLRGKQE